MDATKPPPAASAPPDAVARPLRRMRQQRGLRTEEAILDATLRSVATRGIAETSLDLIAGDVGVAKSSILWHFGSKEGLLLRVAERAFELIEQAAAPRILSLPTFRERSEAMWSYFADTITHRPELRRVVLYLIFASAEGRPELRARLQHLFRSMRSLLAAGLEGVIADAQLRHTLATLMLAALDGIFLQWLLEPDALDLDALHAQIRAAGEYARMLSGATE